MSMSPLGSGINRLLKSPLKLNCFKLRPAWQWLRQDLAGSRAHLELRALDLAQLRVALAMGAVDVAGEPVKDMVDDLTLALALRLRGPFDRGGEFRGMANDRNNRLATTRTASHP